MRTEIATLGEFGLIRHLTEGIELKNKSSQYGVGDDAAVLSYPADKEVLVTTDLLLEGIHFDLTYVPLKHLGYKSAVVNSSDIYAMNGTPRQITVSLGLSKRFSVEEMEELYAGIRLACEEYAVDIVGGDTSSSYTGLTISITCIGEGEKGKVVYRNGAKETDLICVSGDLGAAYMGLQLLEREKSVLKGGDKDLQPDFAGKEYLLERQLKPEARRDIIQKLAKEGIQPTSMMDVSDGLSSELLHICTQSKVGCRIYEEHIPIDYQTAVMAEEFNMNLTTCALNGGEDYELLFTVPIADHEKVSDMEGVKLIGHITKPELGCALITRDGQEFELKAQGWNPLKEESATSEATEDIVTDKAGYFYSQTDGYEGVFSSRNIDQMQLASYDMLASAMPSASTYEGGKHTVGKIVTDYRWYVVCAVSTAEYRNLSLERSSYYAVFPASDDRRVEMKLYKVVNPADDDRTLLIFYSAEMPDGFDYSHNQTVEIITAEYSGYKVPASAVTIQDGKKGVFVLDSSVVGFKEIVPLFERDGWIVCEERDVSDESQAGRLSLYDFVITGGKDLYDGKKLQ